MTNAKLVIDKVCECELSAADLKSIRENPYKRDFPLLNKDSSLAFLDSAASSQRPKTVLDIMTKFYENYNSNPLRGLYRLSVEATQIIEDARKYTANFIGAQNPCEVVFCRNTSEALNIVAKSFGEMVLSKGDEVCISITEHHSNLIPWQQICKATGATLVYMYPNDDGTISDSEMRSKIGEKTKIVAIGHVSNVTGSKNPVKEMGELVHSFGGYLVVDGAQSVAHMPVDVDDLGCDFFAFSGHKALGPFSVGVLWGKKELLEKMPPFLTGGEMIDIVTETDATWAELPEKFEAGTQDAAGIAGCAEGLKYINAIGFDKIIKREQMLAHYCMSELAKLDFVEIYGNPESKNHHGVVSFNVKGIHPHDVSSILDGENVAIRAGNHCAMPLMSWANINSCCRASFMFYNDAADIDRLIVGLKKAWSIFNGN